MIFSFKLLFVRIPYPALFLREIVALVWEKSDDPMDENLALPTTAPLWTLPNTRGSSPYASFNPAAHCRLE